VQASELVQHAEIVRRRVAERAASVERDEAAEAKTEEELAKLPTHQAHLALALALALPLPLALAPALALSLTLTSGPRGPSERPTPRRNVVFAWTPSPERTRYVAIRVLWPDSIHASSMLLLPWPTPLYPHPLSAPLSPTPSAPFPLRLIPSRPLLSPGTAAAVPALLPQALHRSVVRYEAVHGHC